MIRGVPYDSEVEYLESDGTQWIDTGVSAGTDGFVITATLAFPAAAIDSSHNNTILGAGRTDYAGTGVYIGTHNGKWMTLEPGVAFHDGSQATTDTVELRWEMTSGGVSTMSSPSGSFTTITVNSNYRFGSSAQWRSQNFTLFSYGYKSLGPSDINKVKFYSLRIEKGGVLVQHLIPVRTGNVAMMYDRVTGTFPKHYGTFVAGPVVSTPLMGVHMYPKVYTAADFVQNGLIGIWDAIENVDWGVHKSNVPAPVNLIDGKPLTINGGIEIGADYFKFGPGQWGYSECAAFASAIASKSFTIEIVAKNDKVANAGIVSIGSRGVWLYSDGNSNIQTLNILSSTYTPSPQIAFKSDGYWRATILGGESPSIIINDQTTAAQYGTQQSVSPTTLYIGSLAANPSWSNGSLWVKSIRLYSRTLTTGERNHNRSVDLAHPQPPGT